MAKLKQTIELMKENGFTLEAAIIERLAEQRVFVDTPKGLQNVTPLLERGERRNGFSINQMRDRNKSKDKNNGRSQAAKAGY